MSYVKAIETAILIFPLVALLFTMPFILHQYHKYGSIDRLRVLIVYSFILYLMCIYFLVILPLPARDAVTNRMKDMMRLVPFSFISDIVRESSFAINDVSTYIKALTEPCVYTVLFNILMMIPFGMYLRYYFECDLKKTALLSFALSLFFEVTQLTGLYFIYPGPYRLFDVDDLMMNTLGGFLGYALMGLARKLLPSRSEIDRRSVREGMSVSGLRRLSAFLLDITIYAIVSVVFRDKNLHKLIFIVYFILIPIATEGQTLGRRFLNISLDFSHRRTIAIATRSLFIYCYYFGLPFGLFLLANLFKQMTNFSVYLNLMILISLPLFYLINAVHLLKTRSMFYDKLFGVTYKSTIKVENYE